jgi:deoxyribonuclease-4
MELSVNFQDIDYFVNKYKFINSEFYYGCHMPVIYGIEKAIAGINKMGGNCLQIFVSSPMSGNVTEKSMNLYKTKQNDIKRSLKDNNTKLFIHSPYTFNFAKPKLNEFWLNCYWIRSYIKELEIAHMIGAVGCVIHVGKSLEMSLAEAENNMYESLSFVIEQIKNKNLDSVIILETGAGQGTEMFCTNDNTITKLANFYNKFNDEQKKYIKLCVDTCHIFSAGYCISEPEMCINFFSEFESKIGLENLALVHLNDSVKQCNCHVDRHANLGQGMIGLNGIGMFILLSYMLNIPMILETPEPDPKEIIAIKEIAMIKHVKTITDKKLKKYIKNKK